MEAEAQVHVSMTNTQSEPPRAGFLPAVGTVCKQDVPFEQFQLQARATGDRWAALSALRADPKFVRALR